MSRILEEVRRIPEEVKDRTEEVTFYENRIGFTGDNVYIKPQTLIPWEFPQTCMAFNQDISGWDLSCVTDIKGMFTNVGV